MCVIEPVCVPADTKTTFVFHFLARNGGFIFLFHQKVIWTIWVKVGS